MCLQGVPPRTRGSRTLDLASAPTPGQVASYGVNEIKNADSPLPPPLPPRGKRGTVLSRKFRASPVLSVQSFGPSLRPHVRQYAMLAPSLAPKPELRRSNPRGDPPGMYGLSVPPMGERLGVGPLQGERLFGL
jgi:hypothetical protein